MNTFLNLLGASIDNKPSRLSHRLSHCLVMISDKRLVRSALLAITVVILSITSAQAKPNPLFSLENLERERAAFLETLTAKKLTSHQREQQSNHMIKRLIDMERMVLRDDRVAMSHSVMAKNAFQHYELTFLVHASSETQKAPIAHWLHTLKITQSSIYNSTSGAR